MTNPVEDYMNYSKVIDEICSWTPSELAFARQFLKDPSLAEIKIPDGMPTFICHDFEYGRNDDD